MEVKPTTKPLGIVMNIEFTGAIYCWQNRDDRKMLKEWWK